MNPRGKSFWFYAGLVSVLIIAFVYYQGLTADVGAIGPFVIQAGALAQGRNPQTFNFSNYPATNAPGQNAGPSASQILARNRARLPRM